MAGEISDEDKTQESKVGKCTEIVSCWTIFGLENRKEKNLQENCHSPLV